MRTVKVGRALVLTLVVVTAALAPTVALGGAGSGSGPGHGSGADRGSGAGGNGRSAGDSEDRHGAGDRARQAASHTVTLKDIAFHPGEVRIARGDSVTWAWRDGETEHNVTFHGFHSRTQTHGSYTVRFMHSGTFSYECTLHVAEGMKGEIVVH